MIVDLCSYPSDQELTIPVCIIGSGAIGLCMAGKLAAQSDLEVLLVEAGSKTALQDPAPSPVENIGDIATFDAGSYNIGLGGSTRSWGGQILPFIKTDFEPKELVENSGWPISYDEIAPYYAEVEQLIGVDYISADRDIFTKSLERPSSASGLELSFSRWCPEKNFARHFKPLIEKSPKVKIALNSTVTQILRQDSEGRGSIIVKREDGTEITISADAIVIAGGGLENYRLLAQSTEVAKHLPALGHYYHDHIGFYGAKLEPINRKKFAALFATKFESGGKCLPKIALTNTKLRNTQSLNITANIEVQSQAAAAVDYLKDLKQNLHGKKSQRALLTNLAGLLKTLPSAVKLLWSISVNKQIPIAPRADYFLIANCETAPLRRSKLSLINAPADQQKSVTAAWFVDDLPRDAMRDYYTEVKAYLESNNIAKVTLKDSLFADSREWITKTYSLYHHMGSTRMGHDIDTSVVDKNCRVHGLSNVFIGGCSVLPTGSSSNPTFTAMALGLRLVDHILLQAKT